jgi:hypothetical protein
MMMMMSFNAKFALSSGSEWKHAGAVLAQTGAVESLRYFIVTKQRWIEPTKGSNILLVRIMKGT